MAQRTPPCGAGNAPAKLFITQKRKVQEFLADQDRIGPIKAEWLYRIGEPGPRERMQRDHGVAPLHGGEFARLRSFPHLSRTVGVY